MPTNKTDAQVELIAHVINVAARETDYLVGCLADGVLTKIMIVVTGGSLPGD